MSVRDITVKESDFIFETVMRVRSTEVDVGQCLTIESVVALIAEARMRFLYSKSIKDVNKNFQGLVVTDVAVNIQARVFAREELMIEVGVSLINRKECVMHYRLSRLNDFSLVGKASTVLANYDYKTKRFVPITPNFIDALEQTPFEV